MNTQPLPDFSFFVASPQGDLAVTEEDRQLVLEGCPLGTTYGEYFAAIQEVVLRDDFRLAGIMGSFLEIDGLPERITVRAEKHGALYHPASLEPVWAKGAGKFALLVAISPSGRRALRHEAGILRMLQDAFGHEFLPRPLSLVQDATKTFLLVPWFSGFHEFHVLENGGFSLWDHDLGLRGLNAEQSRMVFFEVGRLLTRCLDMESGACIHPWSHAAGDFIVRCDNRSVDVRLTTARGYGPLIETENSLSALFAFFLDLTLRGRLDRARGVGDWVWLDDAVLESLVRGFFAALAERGAEDGQALANLTRLLPSFSPDEILDGYEPLAEMYSGPELVVIVPRLEQHCRELHRVLRTVG